MEMEVGQKHLVRKGGMEMKRNGKTKGMKYLDISRAYRIKGRKGRELFPFPFFFFLCNIPSFCGFFPSSLVQHTILIPFSCATYRRLVVSSLQNPVLCNIVMKRKREKKANSFIHSIPQWRIERFPSV